MKYLKIPVGYDIVLETLKAAFAPALFALIDRNRAFLSVYLNMIDAQTNKEEDSLNFIKSHAYTSLYDKNFPMAIFDRNQLAGIAGYVRGDAGNKEIEIGYWLGKEFCGKGLMTKSVKSLVDYAFANTDVETIKIECEQSNAPSINVAKRLGFRFDRKEEGCTFNGTGSMKVVYLLSRQDYSS